MDFLTTTTFVAISVCSLDFIFTMSFDLGGTRQVSTPLPKRVRLGIAILQVSPNLGSPLYTFPHKGSNYSSPLTLPIGLRSLFYFVSFVRPSRTTKLLKDYALRSIQPFFVYQNSIVVYKELIIFYFFMDH